MKRTNFVTKIISVLLFVALVSYLGVYIIRSVSDDIRTAPAVYMSLQDSVEMSGVLIRDEEYIESGEQYLSISVDSGEMIAAGGTIAVSYSSEDALERAGKIHELELQEQYINSVLDGSSSGSTAEKKEGSIQNALIKLTAAAARHETDQLSSYALDLSALVLDQSGVNATQADLTTVQDELTSLKQTAVNDTNTITASESGLFCSSEDGYEFLTYDDLSDITPSKLESLTEEPEDVPEDAIGKMVYTDAWYYAATMSAEDADRFETGSTESLDFGRYSSQSISGRIVSISEPEDDECVVVFRCTTAMADMLTVRFADADIIYDTCEGLRVPKKAAYVDDDGTYVYTSTGIQAEKKYVNILRDMGDYYLVEISDADDALLANEDIIITKHNIYDGMLLE